MAEPTSFTESAPVLAQGIASSTGLVGALLNFWANAELRQTQWEMYEDQKQWNTPAHQMKLRREAGLNPFSDYASAASPSSPNFQSLASGLPESLTNVSNALSSLSNTTLGRLQYRIQKKALELEEKHLNQELKNMETQREGVTTDNLIKAVDLFIKEQTKGDAILGYQTNVATALENLARIVTENKDYDKRLEAQLKLLGQEIKKGDFNLNKWLPNQLQIMLNEEERTQDLFNYEKASREFETTGKEEFNKILSEIDNSKMNPKLKSVFKIILFFGYQYISSTVNKGYHHSNVPKK